MTENTESKLWNFLNPISTNNLFKRCTLSLYIICKKNQTKRICSLTDPDQTTSSKNSRVYQLTRRRMNRARHSSAGMCLTWRTHREHRMQVIQDFINWEMLNELEHNRICCLWLVIEECNSCLQWDYMLYGHS